MTGYSYSPFGYFVRLDLLLSWYCNNRLPYIRSIYTSLILNYAEDFKNQWTSYPLIMTMSYYYYYCCFLAISFLLSESYLLFHFIPSVFSHYAVSWIHTHRYCMCLPTINFLFREHLLQLFSKIILSERKHVRTYTHTHKIRTTADTDDDNNQDVQLVPFFIFVCKTTIIISNFLQFSTSSFCTDSKSEW